MIHEVTSKVKELLAGNEISGFIGLIQRHGHVCPHLFTSSQELDHMVLGDLDRPGQARYPLDKILVRLSRAYPDQTFGILVRGCDQRGLNTLFVWNQVPKEQVVPVGIACPEELAQACECSQPYPDEYVAGQAVQGRQFSSVHHLEEQDVGERFAYWMQEFEKCIKCFGCRDVCPVCFCKECSLENKELIPVGTIPPANPAFHLTRAVHMAGRCIDCGLCEQACPADIPLRTLYKKVNQILDTEFDYQTGFIDDRKSPLNIVGE